MDRYTYRPPDKASFEASLPSHWLLNGGQYLNGESVALDAPGTLFFDTVVDETGAVTTPPIAKTGWYANLRLRKGHDLPESLLPYVMPVPPATPKRGFAV